MTIITNHEKQELNTAEKVLRFAGLLPENPLPEPAQESRRRLNLERLHAMSLEPVSV
jgi:hypothetical protein